eukprot:Anaeramoba_ignava/a89747_140.p1 GENE.a89747_140~~a89747_140.p1  ORF type:complete len:967 (-),score=160.46 a89747_140:213-3113(-)
MTQGTKSIRLSKVAKELNVGISTIIDFLEKKKIDIKANPNTKIEPNVYQMLLGEFGKDGEMKKESEKLNLGSHRSKSEVITISKEEEKEDAPVKEDVDEVIVKDLSSDTPQPKQEKEEEPLQEEIKAVKETPKEEQKPEAKKEEPKKPEPAPKQTEEKPAQKSDQEDSSVKVVGKIDLANLNQRTRPPKKTKKEREQERAEKQKLAEAQKKKTEKPKAEKSQPVKPEEKKSEEQPRKEPKAEEPKKQAPKADENFIDSKVEKLTGPTVVGKIELPVEKKPKKDDDPHKKKKKRKRIRKDKVDVQNAPKQNEQRSQDSHKPSKKKKRRPVKPEVSEEDVQKQIKETLSRLQSKSKGKGAKHRRDKRDAVQQKQIKEAEKQEQQKNILKVTEFVSVSELANMMSVDATQVIATCMNMGLFVSINQRLDAETMALVADEFNFKVEFVSAEVLDAISEEVEDTEDQLEDRPPIVTVMGHVDHGKTSLLDYVRKANVIAGEAGGITQHIGAYNVVLEDGRQITFLDTPGHEAFTAMRARGAQVTDVAIIIVAADDSIMPQTKEAINHAQAANVPIVFAINKIDKPGANPEKIKEELAGMNLLVEEWGGKYQSMDISAKQGQNVEELLEKVLLEAEMLELKANPNKKAHGTIIESSLDKGRGYVATVLVQAGTLKIGDIVLAGAYQGHVKAMFNERGQRIDEAGPSMPVQILGLNGAPQAGDKFNIMETDQEAREIANKREQLQREQGLRAQKHITLDEIGRRIAIGNFQELNIIVKGDVDGSIEALSDAIIKLSTEEIQVNVIHKGIGQISESDILLAAASNAIIVGFQVRPSLSARKLAEKEEIDIRLYSIIYDAINELRDAMEGMLSPEIKEEVSGTAEILETFKITKVGTIAGCIVREGKINRNAKVRVIRDGIVIYTGELGSLKRFKDDVKEVASGYECGLNIENFNDIKVGDFVEAFKEVEVKKKL